MGTQGSWFWGDTEIWGALSPRHPWGPAVSASLLAIRAKERRTAVPREGLGGGWDMLTQVSKQLWSRSLLFWHLLGRQWWEGRGGEQDVEGQSVTLGPALLCLPPAAWQRVRVGGRCCFFWRKKQELFHPKSVCTWCCWGRRGRGTPGCPG